ncbi:hypothetical protein NIASO_20200 [Niabella soli DSM 19437]|uniref:Uncharacterized protein n=1 Tax=Niabella soli DSM 19437 TaxID=929713 RepID=W0F506_9BACT|nr:hypothetical protein NIASO_20200 [Niabella soli DSM 19437]
MALDVQGGGLHPRMNSGLARCARPMAFCFVESDKWHCVGHYDSFILEAFVQMCHADGTRCAWGGLYPRMNSGFARCIRPMTFCFVESDKWHCVGHYDSFILEAFVQMCRADGTRCAWGGLYPRMNSGLARCARPMAFCF